MIFEINGKRDIGREFFVSVLDPFLNKGITFAIFQDLGKDDVVIDRLHNCVIGWAITFAPSFILYLTLYILFDTFP